MNKGQRQEDARRNRCLECGQRKRAPSMSLPAQMYKMYNDVHGVQIGTSRRRVRGCDYTQSGAREQCMLEAVEYVRGRPDTGPLSSWRFEWK
jgi:hypothetical protein